MTKPKPRLAPVWSYWTMADAISPYLQKDSLSVSLVTCTRADVPSERCPGLALSALLERCRHAGKSDLRRQPFDKDTAAVIHRPGASESREDSPFNRLRRRRVQWGMNQGPYERPRLGRPLIHRCRLSQGRSSTHPANALPPAGALRIRPTSSSTSVLAELLCGVSSASASQVLRLPDQADGGQKFRVFRHPSLIGSRGDWNVLVPLVL